MTTLKLKNGDLAYVMDLDGFIDLIQEHMGHDAARYFREEISSKTRACHGEVRYFIDKLNEIESEISDFKEELEDFLNN